MWRLLAILTLPLLSQSTTTQYVTMTLMHTEFTRLDATIATVTDSTTIYNMTCGKLECEDLGVQYMAYTASNPTNFGFEASIAWSRAQQVVTEFYSIYATHKCSDYGPGSATCTVNATSNRWTSGQTQRPMSLYVTGISQVGTYTLPLVSSKGEVE